MEAASKIVLLLTNIDQIPIAFDRYTNLNAASKQGHLNG